MDIIDFILHIIDFMLELILAAADLPQLKSEIRKFDFPPRKFDSTWFVFDLFHVKSNLHGVRHIRYFQANLAVLAKNEIGKNGIV